MPRFACPCCGFYTLDQLAPGQGAHCDVCGWDDGYPRRQLQQARQEFALHGVAAPGTQPACRYPRPDQVPPHLENLASRLLAQPRRPAPIVERVVLPCTAEACAAFVARLAAHARSGTVAARFYRGPAEWQHDCGIELLWSPGTRAVALVSADQEVDEEVAVVWHALLAAGPLDGFTGSTAVIPDHADAPAHALLASLRVLARCASSEGVTALIFPD